MSAFGIPRTSKMLSQNMGREGGVGITVGAVREGGDPVPRHCETTRRCGTRLWRGCRDVPKRALEAVKVQRGGRAGYKSYGEAVLKHV